MNNDAPLVGGEKLWTVKPRGIGSKVDIYTCNGLEGERVAHDIPFDQAKEIINAHNAFPALPKQEEREDHRALLLEIYEWLDAPMTKPGMREYFHRQIGDLLGKERVEYHE